MSVALAGCGGARPPWSAVVQPAPQPRGTASPPAPAVGREPTTTARAGASEPADTAAHRGGAAPACLPDPASFAWRPAEQARLGEAGRAFEIVERGGVDAAVLRRRARSVPPGLDLTAVAERMQRTMLEAQGVGLAAPQVGLALRAAVLQIDYKTDHPRILFVRNPVIVERSDETIEGYEMCLSVPAVGGVVRRNRWIRIDHMLPAGEIATLEAEGANAVLWQHELDHLDGVLYVDRLLGELLPADEVRRRRKEQDAAGARRRSTGLWYPSAHDRHHFVRADHAEGTWLLGA